MTPIAEVCEAARRLFQMVQQDWWAQAASKYVYQYPRGSGEYEADDVYARPRVYDEKFAPARERYSPIGECRCKGRSGCEQAGERAQHDAQPAG